MNADVDRRGEAAITEIRPSRPEDAPGIRELFQLIHQREFPAALWTWRYRPQTHGAPVTNVAADQGRIMAHVSALPLRLVRGKETMSGGLWIDLMVHPQYRNFTLFLDLAEANRERCRKAGMRLIMAFPNDRSHPVLKRMLGWTTIEEIDALEAPLKDLKSTAGAQTRGTTGNAEPIDKFNDDFSLLHDRLRPQDAWTPSRDAAWLNWRYRDKPGADYPAWRANRPNGSLAGWIVAKIFDGPQGKIGDILDLCAEPGAEQALRDAALRHFRHEGVGTVSAWALKNTPPFERFSRWGLEPKGPRTHFAGRWTSPEDRQPFPEAGREWSICKGDSDVF